MWTCVNCGLEIMFQAVEVEIDRDGCFFICPGCKERNKLINVAQDGDEAICLAQPSDQP